MDHVQQLFKQKEMRYNELWHNRIPHPQEYNPSSLNLFEAPSSLIGDLVRPRGYATISGILSYRIHRSLSSSSPNSSELELPPLLEPQSPLRVRFTNETSSRLVLSRRRRHRDGA